MDCVLLGTSTSIGMPAPLCECNYCKTIERTRPSLLVSDDKNTILFDASPDISKQTNKIQQIDNIDSIFLTHHHHDHSAGLKEINNMKLPKDKIAGNNELPEELQN